MPVSENPVYGQKRKTDFNDRLVDEWHAVTRPRAKAGAIREEKFRQISELLSGLEYWQFRYRLWLARRYAHVRDEVSFLLGSCWSVVRPMAFELGRRMVEVGTFLNAEDTFPKRPGRTSTLPKQNQWQHRSPTTIPALPCMVLP